LKFSIASLASDPELARWMAVTPTPQSGAVRKCMPLAFALRNVANQFCADSVDGTVANTSGENDTLLKVGSKSGPQTTLQGSIGLPMKP
jgi:hypothetical protein